MAHLYNIVLTKLLHKKHVIIRMKLLLNSYNVCNVGSYNKLQANLPGLIATLLRSKTLSTDAFIFAQ